MIVHCWSNELSNVKRFVISCVNDLLKCHHSAHEVALFLELFWLLHHDEHFNFAASRIGNNFFYVVSNSSRFSL